MSSDKVVLMYGASALACLAAIAYQSEYNAWDMSAADEARFRLSPDKLMNSASTPDMLATWFQWIKNVREIDRLPVKRGKRYMGQYMLGPFGPYRILLHVEEYIPGKRLVVTADSWLKPMLQILVDDLHDGGSNLHVTMVFNRTSVLFQFTVGAVARHLTNSGFRHSLFLLRMAYPAPPPQHLDEPADMLDAIHGVNMDDETMAEPSSDDNSSRAGRSASV